MVLEGQTEEQTDMLKKLHALIQESSVGVQTQLREKSSDNLELGMLQFHSGELMVYFKENYSEGFHRLPWGLNFFSGVGVKMLISIETYRTCDFRVKFD